MTSRTYRVSKIIEAPIAFVYEWCTDFREDDWKITGSKSRRKILEKNEKRVIYTLTYVENGTEKAHVSVVTLKPPNAWHLDTAGDETEQEIAEYKLTRLGKNETRLDMVFKVKYGKAVKAIQTPKELAADSSRFWDKLIVALKNDLAEKSVN